MPRFFSFVILPVLLICRASVAGSLDSSRPFANGGASVIREINLARQRPDVYAGYIEELRGHFRGNILALPGHSMLRTREGLGAVDEAIHFLRHATPLPPLTASSGICGPQLSMWPIRLPVALDTAARTTQMPASA